MNRKRSMSTRRVRGSPVVTYRFNRLHRCEPVRVLCRLGDHLIRHAGADCDALNDQWLRGAQSSSRTALLRLALVCAQYTYQRGMSCLLFRWGTGLKNGFKESSSSEQRELEKYALLEKFSLAVLDRKHESSLGREGAGRRC